MNILIFVAVLVVLIVVHEFGHLLAAKWVGMRVDEFGIGFPPRAASLGRWRETLFTLNWLPLGGFVKIFGEDAASLERGEGAFASKSRPAQAFVLVAGVAMNLVLAYILLAGALMLGTPRALTDEDLARATNVQTLVSGVLPESPAAEAGLLRGDLILSAEDGHYVYDPKTPFSDFVQRDGANKTITLLVRHPTGEEETLFVRPETGVITGEPARPAIGLEVAPVGVLPLAPSEALIEGAFITWGAVVLTAQGLWQFFSSIVLGSADFAQVAGPVGIYNIVGGAAEQGLGDLLSLVAIISINLALINLIPVPALDGGRLLFVLIESVIRRPIPAAVARSVNSVGFALLILLMVIVTVSDISKLIG